MGAQDEDIVIEDFKHVKNLVVTKKGKNKNETIIIGAHYDKSPLGCGVIDNWTGIVIIAHLYRTLKQFDTAKNYKFVAFGREEEGLIGSRAMAKKIPKEERKNYCAMVNLDSFGFTYPQVMQNISQKNLIELAEDVAQKVKMPFNKREIQGISDSASFLGQGIPAISFDGLNNRWIEYLHTSRDKIKNVNMKSVLFGYRFTLHFLVRLEKSSCDAFRKNKSPKNK